MNEPIVSISGIRGIFGDSLTPENIVKYASAFALYTGRKKIVIGRDGRLGGELVEKLVESALLFCGCEVINLGIAPTPAISLAVEALKANGGISITASHNPQEWNGMKFINSRGIFLNADENKKFLAFINQKAGKYVSIQNVKPSVYYTGFFEYYIQKVLNIKSLSVKKIQSRKFRVVVDCVNSSGSVIVPDLLEKLGCRIIKVDCDGTGEFTRKPEPLPENLKQVCREVKKHKADFGVVVDPDADRLVFITDEGKPFGEENTITTAVKQMLSKSKRKNAVVNLSTSRSVDDIVNQLGGKLFKAPVGEINVIGLMKKTNAVIGGEGSGGVILPEVHYGRDSLAGIAVILSEFAEFPGKVSEYKKTLPEYHIRKSKLNLKGLNPDKIFGYLKKQFKNCPQNSEDGLRVDFKDSWANFRKSNTEPIMRIITEAKTARESENLQKQIHKLIKKIK